MTHEDQTVQIPRGVLEPIISAQVKAAVVVALKGHASIVEGVVASVLNREVGEDGREPRYGGDKAKPYLDWLLHDCIKTQVEAAIRQAAVDYSEVIQQGIVKQLQEADSDLLREIAKVLIGRMVPGTVHSFPLNVIITSEARGNPAPAGP